MPRIIPCAVALLLMVSSLAAAPILEFEDEPWGQLAIASLESAPYPHPSREEGFASSGSFYSRDPHYVDSSVAFLVPSGYEAGDEVDLIVHFHGHQTRIAEHIPQMSLGEQLEASGVNAILIVPQGPLNASDSRFGKIDEPGGFAALIEESLASLHRSGVTRSETPGRIAIMGHSGGFYPLGQVIANGDLADHIVELWIWDATYAHLERFAGFAARSDTHVRSIFTGHLSEENVDLATLLWQRDVPVTLTHDTLVTDEQLTDDRVVLMHTDLRHMEVVSHFERWARTSRLSQRP
jgi:hypothetical protein